MRHSGKSALITGAGSGIGLCIARRLASEGARVVIAELDSDKGREAAASIEGAIFIQTDVRDEASVISMAAAARNLAGDISLLVNNAGIAMPVSPAELSMEQWRNVIDTNLTSAMLCVKHLLPGLRQTRGSVVNIASTRAVMSEPGWEAYAASKGGLVSLTHALAVSLGPDVRVNVISPGWIHTGNPHTLTPQDHSQHPAGRVGTMDDIASLASFLLSPESGFITGAHIIADGGMTRRMIYT